MASRQQRCSLSSAAGAVALNGPGLSSVMLTIPYGQEIHQAAPRYVIEHKHITTHTGEPCVLNRPWTRARATDVLL